MKAFNDMNIGIPAMLAESDLDLDAVPGVVNPRDQLRTDAWSAALTSDATEKPAPMDAEAWVRADAESKRFSGQFKDAKTPHTVDKSAAQEAYNTLETLRKQRDALGSAGGPAHEKLSKDIARAERDYKAQAGEVPKFTEFTAAGKPRLCFANVMALLKFLEVEIEYDCIRNTRYMRSPYLTDFSLDLEQDQYHDLRALANEYELEVNNIFDSIIHKIVSNHRTNPREDWLRSLKWDGVDRFEAFFETLVINPEYRQFIPLYRQYLYRSMLAATKMGLLPVSSHDGVRSDGVIILCGPQGKGKTTWVRSLLPEQARWVATGQCLDPDNRDHVLRMVPYWIVELGETDGMLRPETLSSIKRWILESSDIVRRVYGKKDIVIPRRTMMVGTVNVQRFLVDPTGNRRFWVIPVLQCIVERRPGDTTGITPLQELNIEQLWAQFVHLVQDPKADNSHVLPDAFKAQQEVANAFHMVADEGEAEPVAVTALKDPQRLANLGAPERAILSLFNPAAALPRKHWLQAKEIKDVLLGSETLWAAELRSMTARQATMAVTAALRKLGVTREADAVSNSFIYAVQRA